MLIVRFKNTEFSSLFFCDGYGRNRDIGAVVFMGVEHAPKIHLVKLVPGEYKHMIKFVVHQVAQALPHGIGRALEPLGVIRRLLCRHDVDKAAAEGTELVRVFDVFIQRRGIILGKDEYPVDVRIDTVRNGNVHQPVFAGNRHGRLAPAGCEGIQAGTGAATQNYRYK